MRLILNIDTAVQTASICLSDGDKIIASAENPSQKDQASWLHPAIQQLLAGSQTSLSSLSAVAISSGPGSYTGLRVGMATAKGLCYTLKLPLICINTLQMMAFAARNEDADLLCPMIDARRMEVFTALFTPRLEEIWPSANLILDDNSFSEELARHRIVFLGNGSHKWQTVVKHKNAVFSDIRASAQHLASLAADKLKRGDFADLAYSEPFYGKDFHSTAKQSL